jgi:Tol biopolymer transport system component
MGWTRDGRFLYVVTRGAKRDGISAAREDGSGGEIPILDQRAQLVPNRSAVSADGKWLMFVDSSASTGRDLWLQQVDVAGATPKKTGDPRPWLATTANEIDPVFSPDGRWVAYASDESGQNEVYVRPFAGGDGKWQVSSGGGRRPLWTSQSGTLLYLALDGGIMKVDWSAVGPVFRAEKPKSWNATKVSQLYDIAPDGRSVLGIAREPAADAARVQASVIVNFFEMLRRPAGQN